MPLTLSVRIYTRHPVHLHLHPVHLRPVHLHLSPAQVLQVFTPTPQLLHFAMTCHFFVCDWGAKVVRNPVCNCTSWEFRRLRNESKVPDDQTVNRLLAAAQLKSPCAGSHLIRTLFIAAESCGFHLMRTLFIAAESLCRTFPLLS